MLAALGGAGVALYVLAWALVPAEGPPGQRGPAALRDGRLATLALRDGAWREAAGMALLVLAGLLFLRQLGLWPGDAIVWPLVLASSGLALLARQAWGGGERSVPTPRRRRAAEALSEPAPAGETSSAPAAATQREPGALPGGVLGAILIVGGALVFLQATGTLDAARDGRWPGSSWW